MKRGIEAWTEYDKNARWMLVIAKRRGKLTLDEIHDAAMEWEENFYALIIKAIDTGDNGGYDQKTEYSDMVELYEADKFLEDKQC